MGKLTGWIETIEEHYITKKVKHKLTDILVIVLFATLANESFVFLVMLA